MADSMNSPLALELPLSREALASLRAGDACTLSGAMYTLRDAGHMRLLDELHERGCLPYDLEGATIFYAGPTPPAAGRPFGAVGPTTASRMDFAAPELHRAGIAATVGKGVRSQAVIDACVETGSVYFVATGGAAALLAQRVESGEVVAYDDLGTEALRRIVVRDFPVFVGVDVKEVVFMTSNKADQSRGVFVSFEGGEGAGKTTHIRFLAETLEARGFEVVRLREPGGTAIGDKLRSIVLDPGNAAMCDACELLVYEAARAQIVEEVIKPALDRGAVVLCDRFFDSTTAYQAYGRGLDADFVRRANQFACQGVVPDRTILLVPPSTKDGLIRATKTMAPIALNLRGSSSMSACATRLPKSPLVTRSAFARCIRQTRSRKRLTLFSPNSLIFFRLW